MLSMHMKTFILLLNSEGLNRLGGQEGGEGVYICAVEEFECVEN